MRAPKVAASGRSSWPSKDIPDLKLQLMRWKPWGLPLEVTKLQEGCSRNEARIQNLCGFFNPEHMPRKPSWGCHTAAWAQQEAKGKYDVSHVLNKFSHTFTREKLERATATPTVEKRVSNLVVSMSEMAI